jgi:hypothetical protein
MTNLTVNKFKKVNKLSDYQYHFVVGMVEIEGVVIVGGVKWKLVESEEMWQMVEEDKPKPEVAFDPDTICQYFE